MDRALPAGLLLVLAGAAPAIAQPHRVALDTVDVIPYRQLTRDDFRGDHPPKPFLANLPVRPVAVSCAYVAAHPLARIHADPVLEDGRLRYRPRAENLVFRAMLSRTCSWWNREHALSPAYVLEHEQIHFALFEVAARRLNRKLTRFLDSPALEGASADSVVAAVQRRVQSALSTELVATGRLNLQFDRATSFGFSPERQMAWRLKVEGDLKQLAPYAAEPPLASPAPGEAGAGGAAP